ncbi:hypothetical protein V6N13_046825 [Hibiscus sabdariffa]|uniref:Uncharacterized protein n=2 Tax=Hibiscus sabdariffa TaxID=183260 RepID=A0ABR2A8F4_9ROSI
MGDHGPYVCGIEVYRYGTGITTPSNLNCTIDPPLPTVQLAAAMCLVSCRRCRLPGLVRLEFVRRDTSCTIAILVVNL